MMVMTDSYQLDWGGVMSRILDMFDERELPFRLGGCHGHSFRLFYDGDDREPYQLDWRGGERLVQSYCWLSWEGFGPQAGRRPAMYQFTF